METVPEKISFPGQEVEVGQYWDKIDAFKESQRRNADKPIFSFYDGPPFATGLPHYGHILAGTIKDIVTRYAHQTGHSVERRFGWDTHGLPIEFEIDKKLGVKTKEDVEKMGIKKYNAECRAIVMRYAEQWETMVKRCGRWIDFENDYKTLDKSFMESVWWVFSQLYAKGLVYRGYKVMPYSTACTTPLSNFESNLNYKDVVDPAIIVSFPLVDDPSTLLLAWTTTPWTLPSNLALCVHPDFDYVKVKDTPTGHFYILLESRLPFLYPVKKASKKKKNSKQAAAAPEESTAPAYEVVETFKGSTLEGKKYVPLFDYYKEEFGKTAFRVVTDTFVTSDAGTGVVHQAPGFGEDDHRICVKNEVISKGDAPCPLDANGFFTDKVSHWAGRYIKDADNDIKKHLKKEGRLIHEGTLKHSYPFCWRSETPLIYRAIPCWFIEVTKFKDRLLANNAGTYWVPAFVKEKRFHNWLADARDWCVSRNRYWGTPLPVWVSEDFEERVVIGSVEELERLSGEKVTDLHRDSIDHIEIPSPSGGKPLKRVEEVFDCWFESGSMPYAQVHYPFEKKEEFEGRFPADFIAEGLDQTRGWFYTLLVLSTALFDKPPFKNLIVNGLVLASDGKKMSKRLKNYPDPTTVIDAYGADALRLYLINSPVVRAEPLKFTEPGVRDVIKDVLLPWFNAYRFLVQSAHSLGSFTPDLQVALRSTNVMDQWILAACHGLIGFVRVEMAAYRLYTVVPRLVTFIDQLTNWYVRFNRKRLRGQAGPEEALAAVNTLYEVIMNIVRAMSPFTPFFTEYLYSNLKKVLPDGGEDSVHFLEFPVPVEDALNPDIERAVDLMQAAITLGRANRDRRNRPLKHPLSKATVVVGSKQAIEDLEQLRSYVTEELNVRTLEITDQEEGFISYSASADLRSMRVRLGRDTGKVGKAVKALTVDQCKEYIRTQTIEVEGHTLSGDDIIMSRMYTGDTKEHEASHDANVLVILDLAMDESMVNEAYAREVVNRVQKLRKDLQLVPTDTVVVTYSCFTAEPKEDAVPLEKSVLSTQESFVATLLTQDFKPAAASDDASKKLDSVTFECDIASEWCRVTIYKE
eukprot:TRINITY_DN10893_c0_g1_i1.p1 TRINITY_DN10893_c0_g1~~TRINITY_DN10893_c0_g1_i1.p1  ORF type:complete len:1098 (+),score=337.49 TRINITY_DN10893_c0_g1_i1:35-3295(+)